MRRLFTQKGMTLIEIMVVLAIVTLLILGAVLSFIAVRQAQLRRDANRVAGAVRYAFDRARATGKDHRIVFELEEDESRFWIEVSEEGGVQVGKDITANARMREEELELEDERKTYGTKSKREELDEDEVETGLKRAPKPKWKQYKSPLSKKMVLKKSRISSIYVARLDETITEGRVNLYFWGNGQTEKAVLHVSDRKNRNYSLITHPLTGRVKLYKGLKEAHPSDIMTDDEGHDILER